MLATFVFGMVYASDRRFVNAENGDSLQMGKRKGWRELGVSSLLPLHFHPEPSVIGEVRT